MAGYRFCRSDDWPLLAQAHEACVLPHAPGLAPCDAETLKRAAREIGLWAGLCMVAQAEGRPVGLLLSAKREGEVLVWRLGVRPDRLRAGHGRHLLTSLISKLAILGPRRIVAEVPESAAAARQLLASCGFVPEAEWVDLVLDRAPADPGPSELLLETGLDDLELAGALDAGVARPWEQAPAVLRARRPALRGLAVAPGERVEAHALWEDRGGERRILALGCADRERAAAWLGLIFARLAADAPGPLRLCGADPRQVDLLRLEALGLRRAGVSLRLAAAL